MIEFIKHLFYKTEIGHWLLFPIKKLVYFYRRRVIPEKVFKKFMFKKILRYNLDLKNPKTLNEKVQWIQMYDRNPLHVFCTDKYAVRKFIENKVGKSHLIPLIYQTDNPNTLIPDIVPDYPVILKTNHGSGGHVIIVDECKADYESIKKHFSHTYHSNSNAIVVIEKSKANWDMIQSHFKNSLKSNYYYNFREWQYKYIRPCIIIEKLIFNFNARSPLEYKFHCFNGKIGFIQSRLLIGNSKIVSVYDKNWIFLDCKLKEVPNSDIVKKPLTLEKMRFMAEILSNSFKYVRVDLYDDTKNIYVGELTFSPSAGFKIFSPPKWDRIFGDQLILE